ncbi:hypothetical protein SAMD00019534_096470, partial [Acytostelium subglobosum LB1]|uniref:hypothetical protein n=1 Tax=Acytostelium subglobosum LB1 TaxID=1410327 RepID=UPI000644FF75
MENEQQEELLRQMYLQQNELNNGHGQGVDDQPQQLQHNDNAKKHTITMFIIWAAIYLIVIALMSDIQKDIDVYQHYISGTCFFQRYHQSEWLQTDESSYRFKGLVEVLVNTNKDTKKELGEIYPNIVIVSTTDVQTTEANDGETKTTTTTTLSFPIVTNVSIDESINQQAYEMHSLPYATTGTQYRHPQRCFFHPLSKEVAVYRSVLPLVYLNLLIWWTATVIVGWLLARRLLTKIMTFHLQFYVLLHLVSFTFHDSIDYTLKMFLQQFGLRCLLFAVVDVAFDNIPFIRLLCDRFVFHVSTLVLYLISYYQLIELSDLTLISL